MQFLSFFFPVSSAGFREQFKTLKIIIHEPFHDGNRSYNAQVLFSPVHCDMFHNLPAVNSHNLLLNSLEFVVVFLDLLCYNYCILANSACEFSLEN